MTSIMMPFGVVQQRMVREGHRLRWKVALRCGESSVHLCFEGAAAAAFFEQALRDDQRIGVSFFNLPDPASLGNERSPEQDEEACLTPAQQRQALELLNELAAVANDQVFDSKSFIQKVRDFVKKVQS